MANLFSSLKIRDVTLPNRLALTPLCMYSAEEGKPTDWLFAHLSTFARGKVGLIFTEATAVEARGRITSECLGIWTDEQAELMKPTIAFIKSQGCIPGIQLAHAGRKASCYPPFHPTKKGQPRSVEDGAWEVFGPSPIACDPKTFPVPTELSLEEIGKVKQAYVDAARRAIAVGFQVIEVHMAHGYLLHSFLSPLSNHRSDQYGGKDSFENRCAFPLEVTKAIRDVIGGGTPLFVRLSAIDAIEGGWTIEDSVAFSKKLKEVGVDVIDCSSGGICNRPRFVMTDDGQKLTAESARAPGFQVPLANKVKNEAEILSMCVGVITDPHHAEQILAEKKADIVAIGRELMYNPFWLLHAAQELGVLDENFSLWPKQYAWAVNRQNQIKRYNAEQKM